MTEEKPIDTGDEKQVKTRKATHTLAREKEVAEFHELLQTYGGRSFLWRLISECGLHHSAPHDMVEAYRLDGRKDIGIWVENEIFTVDPTAYTIMRNEAVSRSENLKGK